MLQKILNLFRRKKADLVNVNLLAWDKSDVERLRNIGQDMGSCSKSDERDNYIHNPGLFLKSLPFPDIYPFPCDSADDEQERYTRLATAFTRRRTLTEMNIPESTFEKEDQNLLANAYTMGIVMHNQHLRSYKDSVKKTNKSRYDESSSDREPYESNTDSGIDWPSMNYGDSSSNSDNGFDFGGGSGDGGGATGDY